MAIKDLINMTRFQLGKLSSAKLKSAYNQLKRTVSKRIDVYKKHGRMDVIPKGLHNIENVGDLDASEKISKIGEMSNFLLSGKSTYTKFMESEREELENIEEDLDIKFKSFEEFNDYKRFLRDMYARDKKGWRASSEQYEDSIDLWLQSRRLNLKASQFLRNRQYWLENVDELKNAKPIKRNTKLYPSDYARQLRLPKVRGR